MRSKNLLAAVTAAIAIILFAGGCRTSPGAAATNEKPAATSAMPEKSDAELLKEVQEVFRQDPVLSKEKIAITVQDARITLVGEVSSGEVRIRAEEKAREIPDVYGVDTERLVVKHE